MKHKLFSLVLECAVFVLIIYALFFLVNGKASPWQWTEFSQFMFSTISIIGIVIFFAIYKVVMLIDADDDDDDGHEDERIFDNLGPM